jgi:hypothetical protein
VQQADRANYAAMAFGLQSEHKYRSLQTVQLPRKLVNTGEHQYAHRAQMKQSCNVVMVYNTSATAIWTLVHGDLQSVNSVVTIGGCSVSPASAPESETPIAAGSILEMRSARRTLREKAREEMSEFEREYPW